MSVRAEGSQAVPHMGERLRELRLRHQLTLRQLAAQAQVSPALLSQLENGVTDPSLSTLRKLATVFQAEISTLFSAPDAPLVHLSRPGRRMHLTSPQGRISYERLTPGRGDLEVLRAVMRPGDISSAELAGHESTECVVVQEGEIVVEIERERHRVAAGEALTFDSRQPHRFRNDSAEPAVFILALTPPAP